MRIKPNMKRIITIVLALATGLSALGQGTVTTKKYRLSDFSDKTTKVVLSGDGLLDGALRQEILNYWTLSAFEFCSVDEFEALKTQDLYYFLVAAESRFKGEETPGILFLTLVKGDPAAGEGMAAMPEVISLPVTSAQGSSGRDLVYLGALVQAVQDFTVAAMESEKVAYSGSDWFNGRYSREGKMQQIYMAREDISEVVSEDQMAKYQDEDFHVVDADEADAMYQSGAYNTLVSYVVAPFMPGKGSYSYQLLFQAGTHALFYIHRHRIKDKTPEGFLPEDLKHLAQKR